MRHTLLLLGLAAVMGTVAVPVRAADEDDPELNGRKCSEYIDRLIKLMAEKPADEAAREKGIERRRFLLDILSDGFGPRPSRIIPAVCKVLREDPEPAVRAHAARWPGRETVTVKVKEYDLKPDEMIDALVRALKDDKSPEVR